MGYGIKIFVPRPLHYVTRSPGVSCYLKGAGYPRFVVFAQLQYNCITEVMTRTCDSRLGGRAYDTVGISWHSRTRSTPGGPSALHHDPLPPFNPVELEFYQDPLPPFIPVELALH